MSCGPPKDEKRDEKREKRKEKCEKRKENERKREMRKVDRGTFKKYVTLVGVVGGRGFRDKALRKFGVGGWVSRPVRYVTAKKKYLIHFSENI